jgi:hypothetical protein
MKGKIEDKKEKRPEFYLDGSLEAPCLIKKSSNDFNNVKEKLRKLPMDILLLAKDYIAK